MPYSTSTPYRGYEIKKHSKSNGDIAYRVFKDGYRFSEMHIQNLKIAKRIIDTYLKSQEIKRLA